jgi:alkylation response protein AidB-like acyl-CoA dehydrogenase
MGASISNGVGRRALELASAYANERKVWGDTPIGAHQGLSHPLAQAKIELELARLMTQKAAALYDAGAPAGEPANMAKYAAAEAAIKCVDQTIQVHGGNGFALEYGLTDMYWGARLARTAPVSREMILNYVAEHSLGLPRSY